ncbi:AsmA family protein [Variovorax sp. J22P271]|uniref:AsmA family protein n=1 Tax=Variovorax davisae TaxID=3053515 RepID=UPI0025771C68|nr:AsmA family protein [Variovorax sp. J22P271]MDM0032231.1 AsmA family protein [Variovorax sp. J22P271]
MPSPSPNLLRRHPVWATLAALVALLVAFVLLFDWNWVRPPLERYISKKTEREFRTSDLHVRLGLTPTIRMRDVYFGNAAWSKDEPAMAQVEMVEFSVSLRDLPEKILVPRVALTRPNLVFERLPDNRKNWILSDPSDTSPSKLRISTLSVDHGRLRYIDHGEPFDLDIQGTTFDPAAQQKSKDADAKPDNSRSTTQYDFKGSYHKAKFSGQALTGDVLSFQESGVPFPLQGRLDAGTTRVAVDGTIADAANISGIDVKLRIEGQTLANLYPFLLLPLPASPPYRLQGHLVLKGNRYTMDDLAGKIGSTDVTGKGAYVDRKPRPLLTADLHSKLLDMADLGPLVGVQTKESGGKPKASQAETSNRPAAKAKEKADDPNHVLPAGSFDGSRLQKIDAEVDLVATKLVVPDALPLESLKASLRLRDAQLRVDPLDFGFAGGTLAAKVALDAREPTIKSDVQVDLQRIRVAELLPDSSALIAKGAGRVGATLRLKGTGNSIADAAAKADGRIAATVVNGRISNLLDAASGLNGGKVLALLAGGDKDIVIRCGGVNFDVAKGRGKSTLFVVDTEQTQVLGSGSFDLEHERFDMTVAPKPKEFGLLSLRTPVRLHGSFKQPAFGREGSARGSPGRSTRARGCQPAGRPRAPDRNRAGRRNQLRRRPAPSVGCGAPGGRAEDRPQPGGREAMRSSPVLRRCDGAEPLDLYDLHAGWRCAYPAPYPDDNWDAPKHSLDRSVRNTYRSQCECPAPPGPCRMSWIHSRCPWPDATGLPTGIASFVRSFQNAHHSVALNDSRRSQARI